MKRYVLIDLIEGNDIVGKYNTKATALRHAKNYWLDTDGECALLLTWNDEEAPHLIVDDYIDLEYDEDTNKVVVFHNQHLRGTEK